MTYTNEKWFDAEAEKVMNDIKGLKDEDAKKYWIKQGLKRAYTEGMHKEIVIKALEQAK